MNKQETIWCINLTISLVAFWFLVFVLKINVRTIHEVVWIYFLITFVPIISKAIYRKLFSQNRKGGN
ncbi:hypothetical protein CHCC14809_3612 [Bacillus licheniformis]|jgi:hypothetical protein|uniref:Uncharacterized protein n=1 Tax=Bacillus glycinifermentans TaxID=1664069 RepID=A0A0T6BQU1_9BACI|nr:MULTISPECIES: hypothetical protein [Bacillus]KJH58238.1 hypothetical protein UF14_07180 [Bacillus licheniformis]KRT94007.1 hypothetical protein AB447_215280 [Bacillus glycinifermentans]MBA1159616.1 hypothetical protein [Bacillus licheniformis]MBM6846062.1 hypothetical protein [Bacillus licheniformis]MBS2763992.1 hypothetical protein [Bacillus licheniformis]